MPPLNRAKPRLKFFFGLAFLSLLAASCLTPARAIAVETDPWFEWASVAWRYYEPGNGVDPVSGLHRGTLDWHYFTDWDLGVYIAAIIDAEALGLVSKTGEWGVDYRLDKVLRFLETRTLRSEDGLPYWAYRSDNGLPGTDQSRLVTDAADAAMLLVSLDRVRIAHPELATRIGGVVDRTRQASQKSFVPNGSVGSGFYGYYYALGYAAFGFNVSITLREMQRLSGLDHLDVYGQSLPPTDITSEPIILAMLELSDRVDPLFKEYAFRVYKAQESRYHAAGTLTAWSEGAVDVAPFYQYQWIVHTLGEPSPMLWKIVGPSQSDIDSGSTPIVYTKVAVALHALYSTEYTRTLIEKVLPVTQTDSGFREGIRERTGEVIGNERWPIQDKTNAIVISAARYALITARQATIRGTVSGLNMQGEHVPIDGALVTATSGTSTRTQANGSYQLTTPPGTYNVTASASNVNISPSSINGHVYQSRQDMIPVPGVIVTAEPLSAGEGSGGSTETDSEGSFVLTVWPNENVGPSSATVAVSEGGNVTLDFLLTPAATSEPGEFVLRFTHSLYATAVQTLPIMPGQSIQLEDKFLNGGSTAVTVSFQGGEYGTTVNTNASATNGLFDGSRRLFNFTLGGQDGSVGSFVVIISKVLLDGTPVVFVDNAPVASTFTYNETHYFVRFDYALSTHTATVGGSNTIPEFPSSFLTLAACLSIILIFRRRHHGSYPRRIGE